MSDNLKLGLYMTITYLLMLTPFVGGFAILFYNSPLTFAIVTTITMLGEGLMFGWVFALLTVRGDGK